MQHKTQLYSPYRSSDLVSRPRLLSKLNNHDRQVALISASAGAGKTALLSQWLAEHGESIVVWLSLSRRDNDLRRFVRNLTGAVVDGISGEVPGEAGQENQRGPQVAAPDLQVVLTELQKPEMPVTLVLDDYHFVENTRVHKWMGQFTRQLPANLRLVLSSRNDPPFPLGRLRAQNQLLEIRDDDLRWSVDEADQFFHHFVGKRLTGPEVSQLWAKTEGWITGMQLAALALRHRDRVDERIASFGGDHRHVADFLTDEVLSTLDPSRRTFLLQTSIADKLCAPLCATLTGKSPERAQQLLEDVHSRNLFLQPLDPQGSWYRYHHLFAEFLRSKLRQKIDGPKMARLQLRAARWFQAQGDAESGIELALAAMQEGQSREGEEALDYLVHWLEAHGQQLFTQGRRFEVQAWLDQIPEARKCQNPKLALLACKVLSTNQRPAEAARLLQAAERALDGMAATASAATRRALQGELLVARASMALRKWQMEDVVHIAGAAWTALGIDDLAPRCHAALMLGVAQRWLGRDAPAWQHLQHAARLAARSENVLIFICARATQARVRLDQACLVEAEALCRDTLRQLDQRGWSRLPAGAFIHTTLGEILWERGDPGAQTEFEQALARLQQIETPPEVRREALEVLQCWLQLMELDNSRLGASGHIADMGKGVEGGSAMPADVPPDARTMPVLDSLAVLQARLQLRLGGRDAVERWLQQESIAPDAAMQPADFPRYVLLATVLLANQPNQALRVLERLIARAKEVGRERFLIEALVLQAGAARCRDQDQLASASFRSAVELAAPEAILRPFLEHGAELREFLPVTAAKYPDIAERLARRWSSEASAATNLVKPLSAREREVLQVLAQGATNREISDHFNISLNTTKTHLRNLYSKLRVQRRSQAILRAREMDLL